MTNDKNKEQLKQDKRNKINCEFKLLTIYWWYRSL